MTPDKAIEILRINLKTVVFEPDCEFENAMKLGIEALKRLQVLRGDGLNEPRRLLPEETKE